MRDPVSLEAASPFELRVDLGEGVPESDVRESLASGELGFLHSFTTGSTVDGPGVRVVAWTTGCMWRCQYCHNPDTWKMKNGHPVSVARASEELRKYRHGLKVMSGGFTLSGGEPLMQHRFAVKLFTAARDVDDIAKIAEFAAGLGNVARVDVLPFHQMGRYKWEKLGIAYMLGDVKPPSTEAVERTCEIFRSAGPVTY